MVERCLEAVEETEIDAEVIDLRTLDRASLDWATIEASVRKTHNVLIVEQGARGTSYGAMVADEIQRRYFRGSRSGRSAGDRRGGVAGDLESTGARGLCR